VIDILRPRSAPVLRWLARPGTLIVLDFDGTLAPIVRNHQDARLTRRTRTTLERLARCYPVAILSGRSVADVRARVDGVRVRWVIGSHGIEWPGDQAGHAAWRRRAARWVTALQGELGDVPGVEIEAKAFSVSVHFRKCPSPGVAEHRVLAAASGLPEAGLIPGKMVVNVLPRGAGDKGDALRRLAVASRAKRVLFAGDDVTDEVAFAAELPVPAVTVRVGRCAGSSARYWIARRPGIDTLLGRLVALRRGRAAGSMDPTRGEREEAP
jgi:trehalose 6-phosphate phosphatase